MPYLTYMTDRGVNVVIYRNMPLPRDGVYLYSTDPIKTEMSRDLFFFLLSRSTNDAKPSVG